jgi:hypothetical protein
VEPSTDEAVKNATPLSLSDSSTYEENDDSSIFEVVAARAALCLYESEMRRDANIDEVTTPSSATNLINDATAFALQKTIDRLKIKVWLSRTFSFRRLLY